MPSVAAVALGIALFGGGTIGLAPDDAVESPPPTTAEEPASGDQPASPGPGAIGLASLAALLAAAHRREDDLMPGAGLGLEGGGPVFVFVPGHGQPHGSQAFDRLIELADIDDGAVRHFDYRWVDGRPSHPDAAEQVPIDAAVSALNAFVGAVAGEGHDVYLVGFSKGGATVAELVADWDDGRFGPSASVVGAALLDPPMASGALGWLQSAGRAIGPVPDDGGYDPVRCSFLVFGCDDRRAHLGESSGIDVVVIRNPRAAITSFAEVPAGLRVYDAADDGPGPWGQLLRNPFGLAERISAAHEAVLDDPRVAGCIVAEATGTGVCDLPRRGRPPLPGMSSDATRAPGAQKVV